MLIKRPKNAHKRNRSNVKLTNLRSISRLDLLPPKRKLKLPRNTRSTRKKRLLNVSCMKLLSTLEPGKPHAEKLMPAEPKLRRIT